MQKHKVLLLVNIFLSMQFKQMMAFNGSDGPEKAESKLCNKLLSSYDKRVRPVLNTEEAVHINISIVLANVLDIDEKHQALTTLLWIYSEWVDPLLAWNETEFGSEFLVIQADEIWTGDLMVYNALGNTVPIATEYLGRPESVKVVPSGKVTHWFPVLLKSYCPMSIELFPFDVHSCPITLSSWVCSNRRIKLSPTQNVAVLGTSQWDVSKNWIVKSFTGKKSIISYEEIGAGLDGCDQMDFTIVMKRKSTFYVFTLLVPCYMISIMACMCYAIPPQGGERINLLLTTFLAIMVFMLVVLEIVPEESASLPLFLQFLLLVMLLNMLQLLYCSFVYGLNSRDRICFGPPKCLVIWAKFVKCKFTLSCKKCPNRDKSKQATWQSKVNPRVESKMATPQQLNIEEINGDSCDTNHVEHEEIKQIKENTNVAEDPLSVTNNNDENAVEEENIKEWRAVLKALDVVLFILNFLGLTVYFIGIIVIYN